MLSEVATQQLVPAEYTIAYRSEPRLSSKCPWAGVSKIATYTGKLGLLSHHEAAKAQSPEFAPLPQPRAWGTRDGNLIRHKNKVYLELVDVETHYVDYVDEDGLFIEAERLEPYLPAPRDEIIKTRTFEIDRIVEISIR